MQLQGLKCINDYYELNYCNNLNINEYLTSLLECVSGSISGPSAYTPDDLLLLLSGGVGVVREDPDL